MYDSWEARIIFKPGIINNGVYLSRVRERGSREYLLADGSTITIKEGMPLKEDPVFATLDDDQLNALQIAITAHGIKPPEASYIQGKLEATERHLEDMRSIVGHVKKISLKKEIQ